MIEIKPQVSHINEKDNDVKETNPINLKNKILEKDTKLNKTISTNDYEVNFSLSNKKMCIFNELPKETKAALSMNRYNSTGNIKFDANDSTLSKTNNTLRNRQNVLEKKKPLEKKFELVKNQSVSNLRVSLLREEVGLRHSSSLLYIPSVEINSRENEIRKLRKTFTNPHLSESCNSLYSDMTSSESIMSSTFTLDSNYSICDSCDSICESILDLLAKKDTKRFTEMENGHLKLIKFSQCPDWLSDNPYIVSNYRPPCYSYKACYKSLLYLHNETGNIYSHIIGAILFTSFYGFTAYKYIPSFNDLDSLQILSIIMSVIGGFICMFFSYHFHMFSSHSLKVNRNWLTCDFIGIVSLIYTTGLPLSYYSFYCLPDFRVKYMAVSAIIGAISLLSMLNPVFSRDEYRLVRSGLFLLLAISELLPVLYAVINFNNDILVNYLSIHWTISGALMYLLGLFLYAKRIPEIYLPGKFDVWGHSHQLFHTLIVFASVSFYIGIMKTVKSYNMDEDVCSKLY